MTSALTLAEVKTRSLDFVNLLGNEHHTTSAKIIGLLGEEFAVQHGEMPPSTGGRDAFLTTIGGRLKLAQGKASVDVKHVIAETYLDGVKGGQCWVYSRKNTPLGCSNSVSDLFPKLALEVRKDGIGLIWDNIARHDNL
jgi:hypothetical protein